MRRIRVFAGAFASRETQQRNRAAPARPIQQRGILDFSTQPAIELAVAADSLDTANKRRDKHLRSPDFFDVEEHPYVRFVSHGATLDGERLAVRGELHARGRSVPLELNATLRRIGDEIEIEATTEADHRQLGMTWNWMGTIGTPTRLMVSGSLVPEPA